MQIFQKLITKKKITNEDIVNALNILQEAGLSNIYNNSIDNYINPPFTIDKQINNINDINRLRNINPQMLQLMLNNNMYTGF